MAETLIERYTRLMRTPSDINDHFPMLCALAKECAHITEMGTRLGVSTTAFLHAQPETLVCYDLIKTSEVDVLASLAGKTKFSFTEADTLKITIEPTDMLFIDTLHDYAQLKQELALHGDKVRQYIAMHDTASCAVVDESSYTGFGLWPAVVEFVQQGKFKVLHKKLYNNGLTVLQRVSL